MAINISKLLSAISAKAANADSSQSLVELIRIAQATTLANDVKQARIYSSFASLPTADSSNVGDIVRVGSVFDSDITKYYVSHGDRWKLITLQDSASIYQGPEPYTFQGSNFGYTSGGKKSGGADPDTEVNTIDKFPFASDASASDVGDLFLAARWVSGQSSSISGYTAGGLAPAIPPAPPYSNVIQKFSFSSDGNGTEVGDLSVARYGAAGQSSSENGYASGGNPLSNVIDKFPFASDANAAQIGTLTQWREGNAGQSSTDNGYTSGGVTPPATYWNIIDKFPFASDAGASDVGDLSGVKSAAAGQSSSTHGYASGGRPPSPFLTNIIDKFPFASDANAAQIGTLTVERREVAGQSSTISGYTSGGYNPYRNEIDKFPFASDANATDVGDLTVARTSAAGQQY